MYLKLNNYFCYYIYFKINYAKFYIVLNIIFIISLVFNNLFEIALKIILNLNKHNFLLKYLFSYKKIIIKKKK